MGDSYNRQNAGMAPGGGSSRPAPQYQPYPPADQDARYASNAQNYYPPPPQNNYTEYRPPIEEARRPSREQVARYDHTPSKADYLPAPSPYDDRGHSRERRRSSDARSHHSHHSQGDYPEKKSKLSPAEKNMGATILGGVVGALAGHEAGHNEIGTILGAVAGAYGGHKLEEHHEKKKAEKIHEGRREGRRGRKRHGSQGGARGAQEYDDDDDDDDEDDDDGDYEDGRRRHRHRRD